MPTLEEAIILACDAHRGQLDKAGAPYILHPLRVMLSMQTETERIVAVLHDTVEDSPVSLDGLRRAGFSEEIVGAVNALTRRDGETYAAYIERCVRNPLARKVKIGDLGDNLDPARPVPESLGLRYQKALGALLV